MSASRLRGSGWSGPSQLLAPSNTAPREAAASSDGGKPRTSVTARMMWRGVFQSPRRDSTCPASRPTLRACRSCAAGGRVRFSGNCQGRGRHGASACTQVSEHDASSARRQSNSRSGYGRPGRSARSTLAAQALTATPRASEVTPAARLMCRNSAPMRSSSDDGSANETTRPPGSVGGRDAAPLTARHGTSSRRRPTADPRAVTVAELGLQLPDRSLCTLPSPTFALLAQALIGVPPRPCCSSRSATRAAHPFVSGM